MNFKIAVIPGDGIGPEVISQTLRVLDEVGKIESHNFEYEKVYAGGAAIDKYYTPLPKETIDVCKNSDAVLLGALGGPKWDHLPGNKRPEAGLLGLRKKLGLFANLRPAILYKELIEACPLKPNIIGEGLDILVVRELTGGIYFGKKHRSENGQMAFDEMKYTRKEVERIAEVAFQIAMQRNKKLTSVDKANVLEVSRFWRETVMEVSKKYPLVELNHLYVDNASMQLVVKPGQFDVILTGNMFGDIISDEASMITGSIGMLPSASVAEGNFGLYEPVHGSAPDIAGMDKANPIATILSAAMMLRYSLNLDKEAEKIEEAVRKTLEMGYRTGDIYSDGCHLVGCIEMTDKIISNL